MIIIRKNVKLVERIILLKTSRKGTETQRAQSYYPNIIVLSRYI